MNDSATPASLPGWLWVPRLVAAGILGQTLFFKFTAAPESVYIFEKVGAGAAGRIGSGVIELVAVVLLLVRPGLGGMLGAGVMVGAIGSHLGPLGIVIEDAERGIASDGGLLFGLAVVAFLCSAVTWWVDRKRCTL